MKGVVYFHFKYIYGEYSDKFLCKYDVGAYLMKVVFRVTAGNLIYFVDRGFICSKKKKIGNCSWVSDW